jgi:hypothetical protein
LLISLSTLNPSYCKDEERTWYLEDTFIFYKLLKPSSWMPFFL